MRSICICAALLAVYLLSACRSQPSVARVAPSATGVQIGTPVFPSPAAILVSTPVPSGHQSITRVTINQLRPIARWAINTPDQANKAIVGLAFSPDGRTLAVVNGIGYGYLSLWDIATGSAHYAVDTRGGTRVLFASDSNAVGVNSRDGIVLWSWAGADRLAKVGYVGLSAWGTGRALPFTLVASGQEAIYSDVYHENGQECFKVNRQNFASHTVQQIRDAGCGWPIWDMVLTRDGRYLAVSTYDGSVSIVDLSTGDGVYFWGGWRRQGNDVSPSYVDSVAFSPNGQLLAWASEIAHGEQPPQLHIWNMRLRAQQDIVLQQDAHFPAFSSDGNLLALASGGTLHFFDAVTGQEAGVQTQAAKITTLAFSPAGNLLVTGADDGTVQFWSP